MWAHLEDDDTGPLESAAILLHGTKLHLRRRADKQIKDALQLGALQLGGYKPAEIREILGLTAVEYREALGWLQEAIRLTSARGE